MKCVVTGAAGFIGSHLVDRLVKDGHQVFAIDNFSTGTLRNLEKSKKKIKIINVDISNLKKIKKLSCFNKVNWVFHLAGLADIVPSINNPFNYFESNVKGTLNVLQKSKNTSLKKFIYAASASCYGIPKKYPTNENSKIDTRYPYALTKYLGEKLVMHWAQVFKMPNLSIRFFNVYGPRSRTTGAYGAMFGVFLSQKINNHPLTIVGNGNQTRDFIFISDIIDGLIKAAKGKHKNKIYNLGSGKETSIKYIANLISKKQIYIPSRPGEPSRSKANIQKFKKDFNWEPKFTINEGVKILLENIQLWKKAPLWTKKKIHIATKDWFKYLK
tara:strand:- start:170 stop:1153 length:984 start_codon:yes stop_codon:yes gene_type:complete